MSLGPVDSKSIVKIDLLIVHMISFNLTNGFDTSNMIHNVRHTTSTKRDLDIS